MESVTFNLNEEGKGIFLLKDDEKELGKMVVSISADVLTAEHTEVDTNEEGKGLGKLLLNAMVTYAKEHGLKVIPQCAYVHAQFKRHPEMYTDIWERAGG